ncbi:adenylate/guanylate cyclase domain-containing protein [Legionella sp.]|uniref:adenylate/guanylate cyclase domain-containing protein n=1 Tax=Legionella sp. TaxID=459 RepID=UPI00321F8A8B
MQTTLEIETLKSEKLRTTILTSVFAVLALMWIIFIALSPEEYHQYMRNASVAILPGYLATVSLYFLLVRKIICQYLKQKKIMPNFLRYLNAFIEVSIPSIGIIFFSKFQTPAYVLLMPPVLIYFLFIILSALTLNEWLCRFSGLVAAVEYGVISYYILHYTNTAGIDPFLMERHTFASRIAVLFIGGIVTGFITSQIKKQLNAVFTAQKERDRIESIFGQHVSPEVVSRLLSKDANASEYIPVCIMFLDIRNFTHFTEQNDPSTVVKYLNNFFQYTVEIIHENKGIINKFLGDGFMAVFGAPISSGNDVANAVRAALTIIQRRDEEVKKGNIPDMKLGIGLHFGYAVTGTIGTKRRLEYTIVGDVVNSAAHIEQLNKTYNTSVLISEDAINKFPEVKAEFVGNATLKHRESPMKLYRLI